MAWLIPPPATESLAWAAFSAWRGHPRQFAQIARRATTLVGEDSVCLIELVVMDDIETFHAVDDFLAQASPQGLARMTAARTVVCGTSARVSVIMARRNIVTPWRARRGIALEVMARGPEAAANTERLMSALVPSIKRGQFWFTSQPRDDAEDTVEAELDALHRARVQRIVSILALFAMYVAAVVAMLTDDADPVGYVAAGAAGTVMLWAAVKWPCCLDVLFPAIDIAEKTPGRRLLTRLGAVPLVPLVTLVLKELS